MFKIKRVHQAAQSCDWSVPEIVVNGFFSQQDRKKAVVSIAISDHDETASISLKPEQKVTVNALLTGEDVLIVSLMSLKKRFI